MGQGLSSIWEEGFCDSILWPSRDLKTMKEYILDNPRRLMLKRAHPSLFQLVRSTVVADTPVMAIGNRWLLNHPEKITVIRHRRYSPEEWEHIREICLYAASNGGVHVSAHINPEERALVNEALDLGGRLIEILPGGFSDRYKPWGRKMDLCAEGRLLQLSPDAYMEGNLATTRSMAKKLNALALRIAPEPLILH